MNNLGLYRAKRKDNGEWVEGYYFYDKNTHFIITGWNGYYNEFAKFYFYEVVPETVCRFTGFINKYKQKIWENDIIYEETVEEKGVVFFKDGCFCVKIKNEILFLYLHLHCKVIGNIFDNPELSEGEK